MDRTRRIAVVVLSAALALATGCASSAWRHAVREDTPAAYYRFLRDHPDSEYTEHANARLEYHKILRRPTLEGLYAFTEKYPEEMELLDKLRPLLEQKAFDVARAAGTADAYDDFEAKFPNGPLSARAAGNAEYLRANGFDGDPVQLADFAQRHPESDFAQEAQRSADSPAIRSQTAFQSVGLQIQIAPGTPEADKLVSAFTHEAMEQYREAGIELVPLDGIQTGPASSLPAARLTITHGEQAVHTVVSEGEMSRPGVMATTHVVLRLGDDAAPIWDREFSIRIDNRDFVAGSSVVLGPMGRRYWDDFFVPVSTWQSSSALRSILNLSKAPASVDGQGDRVVLAYQDGDIQVIDLSNPTDPVVVGQRQRPRDLKTFSGVRSLGDRVAVFGNDGLELVRFNPGAAETLVSLDRGTIGAVVGVERLDDGSLVIAGNRGLMISDEDGKAPMRVLRRNIKGVAVSGEILLFTDDSSVFVATLPMLRQNRVLAQLRVGRDFSPGRVRVFGQTAVVMGEASVMVVDLTDPSKPTIVSQLANRKTGEVRDAARVGERLFLLGDRGLAVLDDQARNVTETVDLASRDETTLMGRHIVAIGDQKLEVLDGTPFRAASAAAQVAP